MDGLKTITILKAARLRIELGGFSELECLCARGEGLKGPKPIDAIYCPMCAIEASQITAGVHNSFHGAAMIELVADVSGHIFSVKEWIERDETLFHWLSSASKAEVLAAFDTTITRLEKP